MTKKNAHKDISVHADTIKYDPPNGFHVSKIEAAKHQIETAVKLWFSDDDDAISIHTLTAAAHNILRDLAKHKNLKSPLLSDTSLVRPGFEKAMLSLIRTPENFFKHADIDSEQMLKFDPKCTDLYLVDAMQTLRRLGGEITPAMRAFHFRFALFNPEYFDIDDNLKRVSDFDQLSKQEFLKCFLLKLNQREKRKQKKKSVHKSI